MVKRKIVVEYIIIIVLILFIALVLASVFWVEKHKHDKVGCLGALLAGAIGYFLPYLGTAVVIAIVVVIFMIGYVSR